MRTDKNQGLVDRKNEFTTAELWGDPMVRLIVRFALLSFLFLAVTGFTPVSAQIPDTLTVITPENAHQIRPLAAFTKTATQLGQRAI